MIVTYDSAGVLKLADRRGNSDQEAASGMAYDLSGNLYVTGIFLDAADQLTLFVEEFSGKELLWQKAAGNAGVWMGGNNGITPAVSVDSDGNIFVTSGYEGTASFGGIKLLSPGPSSIFLAELAPDSD